MRMLLIDDDPLLIEALPTALKRRLPHSTITTAVSAREGLDQLQVERFDVILTDLWMSGMHGDEFTTRMNTITECTPVILITGVIEAQERFCRLIYLPSCGSLSMSMCWHRPFYPPPPIPIHPDSKLHSPGLETLPLS